MTGELERKGRREEEYKCLCLPGNVLRCCNLEGHLASFYQLGSTTCPPFDMSTHTHLMKYRRPDSTLSAQVQSTRRELLKLIIQARHLALLATRYSNIPGSNNIRPGILQYLTLAYRYPPLAPCICCQIEMMSCSFPP